MKVQERLLVALAAALAFDLAVTETAFPQDPRNRELAVIPAGGDARYLPPSPPRPGTYRLGINVQNTPTGVLVVGVSPGSVGQASGIEAGDTLVTVGGYQVGYVGDRLFDLGDELARRVDATGNVTLLVRDGRTGVLENAGVRFNAASRAVSGRIFGPSGTRLPASAVIAIRVLDVTYPQWKDVVVAQGQMAATDLPTTYRLDLPVLQANHRYAVEARVEHGGRVTMQTGQPTPLAAIDRDQQVDLILVGQQPPPGPSPSLQPRDQIDQWIRTYLGRAPRNFETEVWMAELSRGRSMANVQAGILSSSELFERCGRSRDIYVSEVFRLLYGRSPTTPELANLQARYDQALGVRLRFAEGLLQQPR
jgi:uncharacterized lipoprotein YbaY